VRYTSNQSINQSKYQSINQSINQLVKSEDNGIKKFGDLYSAYPSPSGRL
jgi:hypothetical protein